MFLKKYSPALLCRRLSCGLIHTVSAFQYLKCDLYVIFLAFFICYDKI